MSSRIALLPVKRSVGSILCSWSFRSSLKSVRCTVRASTINSSIIVVSQQASYSDYTNYYNNALVYPNACIYSLVVVLMVSKRIFTTLPVSVCPAGNRLHRAPPDAPRRNKRHTGQFQSEKSKKTQQSMLTSCCE